MTQSATIDDSFTFVGGLNTEGGYFVTPKNSWKEGQNMVPQKDGSLERRPAVVLESNYESIATLVKSVTDSHKIIIERWDNVGNRGDVSWFVIQINTYVYFYEAFAGTTSIRAVTGKVNGVDMSPVGFSMVPYVGRGISSATPNDYISVASVFGNLIITQRICDPIFVEWSENNILKVQKIALKVRDFTGIPSPRSESEELTQTQWENLNFWPHALYNLYNQGWYDTQINTYKTDNDNKLPANTKQWIFGKNADNNFRSAVLNKIDFGTSPAPKGRFILDAFYMDRAVALSQLPDLNTDTPISSGTPSYSGPTNDQLYWQFEHTGGA